MSWNWTGKNRQFLKYVSRVSNAPRSVGPLFERFSTGQRMLLVRIVASATSEARRQNKKTNSKGNMIPLVENRSVQDSLDAPQKSNQLPAHHSFGELLFR